MHTRYIPIPFSSKKIPTQIKVYSIGMREESTGLTKLVKKYFY